MSLTFACHEALLHFPDEVQHIWRYAHSHLFLSILTYAIQKTELVSD
jgi:hypothetical protein